MKPAKFRYERPATVPEALALVRRQDEVVKILAGGQSLTPLMNFRLATPDVLVDITRIPELSHLTRRDGQLRIGATTRHRQLEESPMVREHWPVLAEAVTMIGHQQIRNAGTVGGSVVHADPAAELPAVLSLLDARFVIRSSEGERVVPWDDFFVDQLQTAVGPDELLVEIVVPPVSPRTGGAFSEFSRRQGDFAQVGCGALITLSLDGLCESAAIVLLAAGPTPLRPLDAEQSLVGRRIGAELAVQVADQAVASARPADDMHASSDYRRAVLRDLLAEAIVRASERAG